MQTLPVRVGQPAEQPAETGSACSATLEQSQKQNLRPQTVILQVKLLTGKIFHSLQEVSLTCISPFWFVQILQEEEKFKETKALTFQDLYEKNTL